MKRFLARKSISGSLSNGQVQRRRNRLTKLIVREDWKGFLDEIDSSSKKTATENGLGDAVAPAADEAMVQALLLLDIDSERSALHIVCRAHPPFQVVQKIVLLCPASVKHLDKAGHSPLHSASEWGACPRIIEFLIKRYPRAACMVDMEGKNPLHLCCENCSFEESCDTGAPWKGSEDGSQADAVWPILAKGPLLPVVKALLKAAPDCVNLEDDEEMNALEYAIMFDADVKVVKVLQKASTNAWKLKTKAPVVLDYAPSMARTSVSSTASESVRTSSFVSQFAKMDLGLSLDGRQASPAVAKLSVGSEQKRICGVSKAA
jgi:hypothetical protein